MNDLMLKKGFSNIDNKYFQLFKKRPLLIINRNYSDLNNQMLSNNNIFEKPNNSTNDKLNQIIQNLSSKRKLRKIFLNTNEYYIANTKIKDLLKKNKLIEKKRIENKVEKLDGIHESIQRLIRHKKRFALEESLVKFKIRENNKIPSICSYNPNYKSISKHIPIADLQGHHNINLNNLQQIKNEDNNKYNIELTKEKNNDNDNNKTYIPKDSLSINSYDYKKNISRNNLNHYQINNYSQRNNNKINNLFGISDYSSIELSQINPEKIQKNISVPNFNKMTSREQNNFFLPKQRYLADYFPNYDSIYSNANKFMNINKELKDKKSKLRKIISYSNPPAEYLLLPILNN